MRRQSYKRMAAIGLLAVWCLVMGAQSVLAAKFENPLGSNTTFSGLIIKMTQFLLGLVGFLAMASLVWGGTMYIISLGNDNLVQQAKKIILWAVIGLIVIILSFVIIMTVQRFLGVIV